MNASDAPPPGLTSPWRRWLAPEYLALAVIVAAALAMRLFALGSFPQALNADEAENTADAIRLLTGDPPIGGIFGLDWKPQPAFNMYLLSLFVRIFGENIVAVRLPSALFSTLTLIPFYLLLRRHISIAGALATTFLLSTHIWYLHFSRNAWDNISICLYTTAGVYFLLRGIDRIIVPVRPRWSDWWPFGISGIFAALGLYGYFSGRLIAVILAGVALVQIWHRRPHWRRIAQGTAITIVVAFALFAPMIPTILENWEGFNRRTTTVLLTNQPAFRADPVGQLRRQIGQNLIVLWNGRASNQSFYFPVGEPWLDLPTRLLVLGGMLLTFRGIEARSHPERWVWWVWLGIGWFATQILSTNTPDGARGIIFLPALIAFAAFGIDWAITWIRARQQAAVLLILGALTVFWIGFNQVQRYISWQSAAPLEPYVLAEEFPAWAEDVRVRAIAGQPRMSIGQWRERQMRASLAPPPASEPGQPQPTRNVPIPAGSWPQPTLILGQAGELREPRSVGFGPDGLIYVLDSAADIQTVSAFDTTGKQVRQWGGKGNPEDPGLFVRAWALTTDQSGAIYVLDAETGWVHVFDSQGNLLRRWGGPDARLYFPRAMATGPDGNIYIADTGGRRVVVFSPEGSQITQYGSPPDGPEPEAALNEPSGMAVAPDGSVLIADATQGMMRRFTPDNQLMDSWPSPVSVAADGPRLAAAADGSIFLTLPEQCQVARMTLDGQIFASFGGCSQPELLQRPSGLAVAPDGRLAVTDIRSARVLIFPSS